MEPVEIDISERTTAWGLSQEEIDSYARFVLGSIAAKYKHTWEKLVTGELKGTKNSYISGMKMEFVDDYNVAFILEGKEDSRLGLMIEQGASAFDEKEGFEKSSKKTTKKDGGWFLTVPFKMATSDAIADSALFSGSLPDPIRDIAMKQKTGVKEVQIPEELKVKGVRKELEGFPEYKHKSSPFEGVVRKVDEKGRGTYLKFRRVSDNSDESSWIHPGFTARNFMERAFETMNIETVYDKARDEFFKQYVQK